MKIYFNVLILLIITLLLVYIVFTLIDYLSANGSIMECFTNNYLQESQKTSHTVNLPLTTTYSCKNFCGPTSRCSITGQQCFADIDCPGCQPYSPPLKRAPETIPGADDAGKLTVGVSPTYSPLTSGFGTKERIVTKDLYDIPVRGSFGVDTWGHSFNETQALFNKRYKYKKLKYVPKYLPKHSLTGEFVSDGPLPSNY